MAKVVERTRTNGKRVRTFNLQARNEIYRAYKAADAAAVVGERGIVYIANQFNTYADVVREIVLQVGQGKYSVSPGRPRLNSEAEVKPVKTKKAKKVKAEPAAEIKEPVVDGEQVDAVAAEAVAETEPVAEVETPVVSEEKFAGIQAALAEITAEAEESQLVSA